MADAPRQLLTMRQILSRTHRHILLLACLLVAALMISGFLTIRDYYHRNLELITRSLNYAVEPAIVFGDPPAMRDAIASVVQQQDVRSVELRDTDGQVLVRWEKPRDMLDFAGRLPGIASVRQDVRQGQATIGELRVTGNTSLLSRYLLSGLAIAVIFLGFTFFAIRVQTRRIESKVISPLADIAQVARDVRGERAFDRRAQPSQIAEIDQFGQDFNALLAELQGWHASITEEKDKLAHDAAHDPLTGLGNRSLFNRNLETARVDSIHSGRTFALLYLDVDKLKQVNDASGHQAGDALLIGVAERLRTCIRAHDQAFRIGGDEFAIIIGATSDHETLAAIVSRINSAMVPPLSLPSGETLSPSVSVGGAVFPNDGASAHELIRKADAEMYRHKLSKQGELTK